VIVPLSLIFFSVSSACAAPAAPSAKQDGDCAGLDRNLHVHS
jgi:hypothetical protein